MSDNHGRALAILTDTTVVDYTLLDEYLRTFELLGFEAVSIAHVRECIETFRRQP